MKTNTINENRISRLMKRVVSLAVLLSLSAGIVLFAPGRVSAAPSQFDRTFGNAGTVRTNFGSERLWDMAIQPDGKIVAVGWSFSLSGFVVARYNANGALDTTFDGDGWVAATVEGRDGIAQAVAIQPDGKIVVVGSVISGVANYDFALVRINSNGSLDTTFDGDGGVVTALPNMQSPMDLAIQPDGKIVVVGSGFSANGVFLVRYNPNGSLDTSFDTDGIATTTIFNAFALALQPDGKIVVAGAYGGFGLVRFTAAGAIDTSFGTEGFVITSGSGSPFDVFIQPDGKIVSAGSDGNFLLTRVNGNGSIDPTFGSYGAVSVDFGRDGDGCAAAALQPDGKITAVGNSRLSGDLNNGSIVAARFNSNGSLDTSFHGDGKLQVPNIDQNDQATAAAIQADGKIVLGGYGADFYLMRFLGNPRSVQTNSTPIAPADRIGINPPTLSTSTVNIGGLNGWITKVRVSLNNITHNLPADLDVLLESPTGVRTIIASDAIAGSPAANLSVTLDQSAVPMPLPALNTGFYFPTNLTGNSTLEPGGIDNFPAPGPGAQNYGAGNLDIFNGSNPNGVWKLYVVDDEAGNIGSIGGWTLDVTTTTSRLDNLIADYDGDGRTDISVFRPSNGQWWLNRSFSGTIATTFGVGTDEIAPGDYTGDGKTDIAFFRPSTVTWFFLRSEDNTFYSFPYGSNGDVPVSGDYDGDGRTDAALFRPSNSTWYVLRSTDLGTTVTPFGASGDVPTASDYDGDGKADIAIFRPSAGEWWIRRSSDNTVFVRQFGSSIDKAVQADYTGDGKSDVAIWRPSTGEWFVLRSEDLSFYSFPFGISTDMPAPGDYDGDGKFDAAIFRSSNARWYVQRSTAGTLVQIFGQTGDIPVPGAFVP